MHLFIRFFIFIVLFTFLSCPLFVPLEQGTDAPALQAMATSELEAVVESGREGCRRPHTRPRPHYRPHVWVLWQELRGRDRVLMA